MKSTPVIFIDFGGVYFTRAAPIYDIYSRKFGMPRKRVRGAMFGTNWLNHSIGKCSESEYWKNVAASLNLSDIQAKQLRNALYAYSKPQKGMASLIRRIKKKYKVAVLSDNICGWVGFLEKKYKISNEFHDQHYSYHHGFGKPNVNLFKRAANRMNVKHSDCIVVDNDRVFLSGVKKTGARVVLFKDAKNLESRLRKYGVEI